jgi:hypothetical protein
LGILQLGDPNFHHLQVRCDFVGVIRRDFLVGFDRLLVVARSNQALCRAVIGGRFRESFAAKIEATGKRADPVGDWQRPKNCAANQQRLGQECQPGDVSKPISSEKEWQPKQETDNGPFSQRLLFEQEAN